MENSGKEETKTREDRREAAPARVPALVGVAAPSAAGSGGAGDALPIWSKPGSLNTRAKIQSESGGRALISLLQHLAKHNALHCALENAAEDIVDRCFVTESRAGIIIAALAKFRSCLLDFDAPCRDLANLSPHPRDFLVSAGDRLREPIDLFDDGAVFVRLRSRGLTIERPHIIARIVLRHEFDRLGESTLVVLPGDCIILTVERLQLSARLRNVNWSIAHL